MFKFNPLTAIDFYKAGHHQQYPVGTTAIYSNFTPRNLKHLNVCRDIYDDKVVFFGLQAFIIKYLIDSFNEEFFNKPLDEVLNTYKWRMDDSLFTDFNVEHIKKLHDLGYLPLRIKALPEGSKVRAGVPVFTIINTHPDFYWLTNYIESVISAEVWKKMVNATIANHYRMIFEKYADMTGSPKEFIYWQGHDFSFRGMSCWEDATMNGMAHLTSFRGTDTVSAIDAIEYFYRIDKEIVGGSVPATEHSVMCAGGLVDERETFKRLITEVYPNGIVSIVSDTWDFWNVLDNIAPSLKEEITSRNGKVVFRPDSGDPVEIICGKEIHEYPDDYDLLDAATDLKEYLIDVELDDVPHGRCGPDSISGYLKYQGEYYKVKVDLFWGRYDKQYYYLELSDCTCTYNRIDPSPEILGAVRVLDKHFGHTLTEKGYKVLNEKVGLIYGDSITPQRANEILKRLEKMGYASCNCVFGIGSYTYNYSTRDSIGAAMKSTWAVVNGEAKEIFKDPKTDNGIKKSAKGALRVELINGDYVLYDQQTLEEEAMGDLEVVFRDGSLIKKTNLCEIRDRLISPENR